jgi:hypothetical protein
LRHIASIPNAVLGAFLPISPLRVDFWGISLLTSISDYLVVVGFLLFLLSLAFFIKKPEALLIYLLSSMGLFGIFFLKSSGTFRHHGLLFILFIFSLWISKQYKEKSLIRSGIINKLFSSRNLNYLLIALLSIQLVAAGVASYYELNYDFSAGKKTAIFLKENDFINNDTFIAIYPSYTAATILPYIPEPYSQFYCVELNSYCSYMVWNEQYYYSRNLSIDEVVNRVDNTILDKDYKTILLVLNRDASGEKSFSERYYLIAYFNRTIVSDDSFYIYQLR